MTTDPRRLQLLESIGIGPVWVRRHAHAAELAPAPVAEAAATIGPVAASAAAAAAMAAAPAIAHAPQRAAAPAQAVVDAVPAAHPATIPAAVPATITTAIPVTVMALRGPADMNWAELQQAVSVCELCDLCRTRTRTVFGVGDVRAKWLFIGEGPGRSEDQQGEPFVGPAGKLLDNMLAAMQLQRGENAYIANIVKCRPTDQTGRDRAPNEMEIASCLPYLQRQIALIQPTILVALGKTAALALLDLDAKTPVASLRGRVHQYQDLPLVVTYHPAYLLRQPGDKGKVWADLCLAMTTYAA